MKVSNSDIRAIVLSLALALALATGVAGTTAASAAPTARLGSAVAVGDKADGIAAICAREARRKALRSGTGAKASGASTGRVRRTKAALRRRCMRRLRRTATKAQATATAPATPNAGPLTVGIDGGYSGWDTQEVEFRTQLGAAVTRHEWDPSQPVGAQDDVVLEAASEIHTRIHALLGGNELG